MKVGMRRFLAQSLISCVQLVASRDTYADRNKKEPKKPYPRLIERYQPNDRPRLLSHVGRWGRARRWLPPDARCVADVGCAFGYGTAALTGRGRWRRFVVGIEYESGHIELASKVFPWLPIIQGDAAMVPLSNDAVDAVVMLDILEHVADPTAVLAEAYRILRPGGYLVVSVPHQTPLAVVDPLNAYPALRRRWRSWPPLETAEESATGTHRHFTVAEARDLLGPGFVVERTMRTGLGLSEILHLTLIVAFKAILVRRRAYLTLRPLHFAAYLIDDLIPTGPLAYHLTLGARVTKQGANTAVSTGNGLPRMQLSEN